MRDHAEVYIEIWDDPDFIKLSPGAQRLYFLLLSQRRLEYSGVLPLRPSMWAELSSDTTDYDIATAIDELVEGFFIVVDDRTSEVLIRSFFRRDVARIGKNGGMNLNLVRSALEACNKVDSPLLRAVLVREVYRCAPLPLDKDEILRRFPDLSEPPYEPPCEGGQETPPGGVPEKGERSKEQGEGVRSSESGARSSESGVANPVDDDDPWGQ